MDYIKHFDVVRNVVVLNFVLFTVLECGKDGHKFGMY